MLNLLFYFIADRDALFKQFNYTKLHQKKEESPSFYSALFWRVFLVSIQNPGNAQCHCPEHHLNLCYVLHYFYLL